MSKQIAINSHEKEEEELDDSDDQLIPEKSNPVDSLPVDRINSWIRDSPIEHCPICFDHRRTGSDGQTICTSAPAKPNCPMVPQ